MIAQTKYGTVKISPAIYGKEEHSIIYNKDSKIFKLGRFYGTKKGTLKKVGEKYGKESEYYRAILNFETLEFEPKDYKYLFLQICYIENINLSKYTELKRLYVQNNYLTSIDVSNNTELKVLFVYSNCLTSLDVSNNTKLSYLDIENNSSLKVVKIKKGQKIEIYRDNHTKIVEVD